MHRRWGGEMNENALAKPPRRFMTGLAIGLGAAVVAVVIVAVVALVLFPSTPTYPSAYGAIPWPTQVKTVQLNGPWIKMTDNQHGTVVGWSQGTSGWDGSGMPGMPVGVFASFELFSPTEQDGVKAMISTGILVTHDTKLLMGGQPYSATTTGGTSAIDSVFGMYQGDTGPGYLDMRELTVSFKRDGDNLIAESIDASATEQVPPFFWAEGY